MMVFKITAESVSSYYAIENYFLLFCIFSKISLLTSGKDALSYTSLSTGYVLVGGCDRKTVSLLWSLLFPVGHYLQFVKSR